MPLLFAPTRTRGLGFYDFYAASASAAFWFAGSFRVCCDSLLDLTVDVNDSHGIIVSRQQRGRWAVQFGCVDQALSVAGDEPCICHAS